jgi:hypothetical protein
MAPVQQARMSLAVDAFTQFAEQMTERAVEGLSGDGVRWTMLLR